MASIPAPIRATLGLLATAIDTVQELVEHAPELPMEAVGNSMQLSLRLQQQYVALLTRGDEFLANLRGAPEEPPAWATFDESPVASPTTEAQSAADEAEVAVEDLPAAHREGEARHAGQGDPLFDAVLTATIPPAKKASKSAVKAAAPRKRPGQTAAKKAAPRKAAPRKAAAVKATALKATPTTAVPAAKALPAKKAVPAKKSAPAAKAAPAKKTTAGRKSAPQKSSGPAGPATPRRTRKTAPPAAETAPTTPAVPVLDVELDNGLPSARQLSAFDLAPDVDAPTTELIAAGSPATVAIDATPAAENDPSSDAS